MAATQVFYVPELLERILADLTIRNLLHAQRVCRHWNEVISHSPTLQQKLFFLPARKCPQPQENPAVDINPLLQELFPPFMTDLFTLDYGNANDEEDNIICLSQSRPIYNNGVEILQQQEWYKSETTRRAVLRPDASWRRMFPSHPPPRLGIFDVNLQGCGCGGDCLEAGLGPEYQALNHDPGLRMGLIWDAVVFVLDDLPRGGFSISWWRRRDSDIDDRERKKYWMLELAVETLHRWECFGADEAYGPSGLKVVDYDGLIEYKQTEQAESSITEMEAAPLSVISQA